MVATPSRCLRTFTDDFFCFKFTAESGSGENLPRLVILTAMLAINNELFIHSAYKINIDYFDFVIKKHGVANYSIGRQVRNNLICAKSTLKSAYIL